MGTSYTDYGPLGFWARDSIVEAWLLVLVAVIDAMPAPTPWLRSARDDWQLQATAGFVGCVCVELDRHLAGEPAREAEFLAALDAVGDRLDRYGAGVPPEIAARIGDGPEWTRQVADQLRRFTRAVAGLVRGEIAWDTHTRAPGVWPSPTT